MGKRARKRSRTIRGSQGGARTRDVIRRWESVLSQEEICNLITPPLFSARSKKKAPKLNASLIPQPNMGFKELGMPLQCQSFVRLGDGDLSNGICVNFWDGTKVYLIDALLSSISMYRFSFVRKSRDESRQVGKPSSLCSFVEIPPCFRKLWCGTKIQIWWIEEFHRRNANIQENNLSKVAPFQRPQFDSIMVFPLEHRREGP